MSQKLIVSVDASKEHPDLMTVQDVFTHVLELFQLVNESDLESQGQIVWKLVSASMNSPFTVTAEAVATRQGIQTDIVAQQQKRAFARNYNELKGGRCPREWSSPKMRETVSRVLARNRNGIGSTKIDIEMRSEIGPIVITAEDAAIAAVPVSINPPQPHKTKEQIGSVEGKLLQVASHYGHPAIQILERKNKAEIWCVVPEAFQHEISENTSVEDVWRGSRVVVRGSITYSSDGNISRVVASNVRRIEPKQILENAITDKEFTGGLSVSEYLERLRDGTLG